MSEFDFKSWWLLEPLKVMSLDAREHRLPSKKPRAPVSLWQLGEVNSPELLAAVGTCATYWARELDAELPYNRATRLKAESQHLWAWTIPGADSPFTLVGACQFDYDEHTTWHPHWRLSWVWLHPFARHRGTFRASWSLFIPRYQSIAVAPRTLAIRAAIHGTPHHTVTTVTGEPRTIYTETPQCPRHGAMVEIMPGIWRCGAKVADGDEICPQKWPAPRTR